MSYFKLGRKLIPNIQTGQITNVVANPFVDVVDQSAISSAFSIGKNLMKKSTGWFFGGGGGTAVREEEEVKIDPGIRMEHRSQVVEKGQRKGIRIVPAPYGIPIAAVSDSLGRVSIVDTNKMQILRMIKVNSLA